MELIEAIKSRRSIRQYEEGFVIPFEDLKKIIEAGMYAPSAMRRMPWEFLVITDQVLLSTIEKTHNYAAFATSNEDAFFNSSVVILKIPSILCPL